MKRDSFVFYRSFREAGSDLNASDRAKFYEKVIRYGIEGELDGGGGISETMFKLIRPQIDANNKKYKNGKKGGRPTISQKEDNEKPEVFEKKTKGSENKKPKDKKTIAKSGEKGNIMSEDLFGESKEVKKKYGNVEINECLDIIKKSNGGICDGTQTEQRRYGKHLVNKLKKVELVQNGKYSWEDYLKGLILVVSKNKYHGHKLSGPKSIYYKLGELQKVAEGEMSNGIGEVMGI